MKQPEWQTPLYEASVSIACLLDTWDELEDDVSRDLSHIQLQITRLENILYKEKANAI